MKPIVVENPVINSPFDEPGRHFRFSDEGITNKIADARRESVYFIPILDSEHFAPFELRIDL